MTHGALNNSKRSHASLELSIQPIYHTHIIHGKFAKNALDLSCIHTTDWFASLRQTLYRHLTRSVSIFSVCIFHFKFHKVTRSSRFWTTFLISRLLHLLLVFFFSLHISLHCFDRKKRTQRQTFNTEQMQLIFNSILCCYSTWARRGSQGLVWRTKGSFILVYAVSLIRICSRLILFFYFSSSSFSNVAVTL